MFINMCVPFKVILNQTPNSLKWLTPSMVVDLLWSSGGSEVWRKLVHMSLVFEFIAILFSSAHAHTESSTLCIPLMSSRCRHEWMVQSSACVHVLTLVLLCSHYPSRKYVYSAIRSNTYKDRLYLSFSKYLWHLVLTCCSLQGLCPHFSLS